MFASAQQKGANLPGLAAIHAKGMNGGPPHRAERTDRQLRGRPFEVVIPSI